MSTGPVLPPLFNVVCLYLGLCEFHHISGYYIIPPNIDVTIKLAPEEDNVVQVVFALTFGEPRDLYTSEVVYTDQVGFWHRGRGMKHHWDPLTESIINVVYPHITPVTKQEYFEVRFINRTNRVIVIDVSVWTLEYTRDNYEKFISMIRGFYKLLRLIDASLPDSPSPEDLRELLRRVRQ